MELLTHLLACIKTTKEQRVFNEKIRKDGLEIAIKQFIKEINDKIPSKEIAMKFVLQELDLAQQEKSLPQAFISDSGFHPLEYEGTVERFRENDEDLLKIQTLFDEFLKKIREREINLVSIEILDGIMDQWKIGRYSPAREREAELAPEPEREPTIITEEPKETIHYDANKVSELMEEYSDIIGDIITGTNTPEKESRMEVFKNHISEAGMQGESDHALVLCCFYEHKEPYNTHLPIPLKEMSDLSLNFFRSIVKGFSQQGFSQPFIDYIDENKEEAHLLT